MIFLKEEVYKKVDSSNLPTMHIETYIWNNYVVDKCKAAETKCLQKAISMRTNKLSIILQDDSW